MKGQLSPHTIRAAGAAVTFLLTLATPLAAQSPHAQLEQDLQATLDSLRQEHGFPGATAAVALPDGTVIEIATGFGDVEAEIPMRPATPMPSGSVGKSFAGAVVLDLVERGLVDLDAPIARLFEDDEWYTELANSDALTLRHLLNHGSGLQDWLNIDEMVLAFFSTIGTDVAFPYDHTQKIAALAGVAPLFPAGSGFAYADANYILAGLAIERIAGKSYETMLVERFLDPLELDGVTTVHGRDYEGVAVGYMDEGNRFRVPRRVVEDGRFVYDPELEWTAGGLITTAPDLAKWGRLLYGGYLFEPETQNEMIDSANGDPAEHGFRYGIGVQLFENETGTVLGHGGWIFGYTAGTYYHPDGDFAVAVQLNSVDRGYTEYAAELADVFRKAISP